MDSAIRIVGRQELRQVKGDDEVPGRGVRRLEPLPLDWLVDDGLWQVQGQEVGHLGNQHNRQNHQLLAPTMTPYVFEKIGFHQFFHSPAPGPATYPDRWLKATIAQDGRSGKAVASRGFNGSAVRA